MAVVIGIIVLGSVLVLGFRGLGGGGGVTQSTHTVNITNDLITVKANDYEYYPFYVPSGATNVQVQGSFTASGGSVNDIEVLVMDPTEFINWQNGHQTGAYYDSGQLTTSSFDVPLPSGQRTYYLVYSNTFSMDQKNVNTQANLTYTS
ncbi:MAG: hypothetical protein ABR962_00010 [Candidatus Bathyarchaeia archaeon]|jgi:hypothetical protein